MKPYYLDTNPGPVLVVGGFFMGIEGTFTFLSPNGFFIAGLLGTELLLLLAILK